MIENDVEETKPMVPKASLVGFIQEVEVACEEWDF